MTGCEFSGDISGTGGCGGGAENSSDSYEEMHFGGGGRGKLNLTRNGGKVLKLLPEWKFIKVVLPRRLLLLLIYLLEHYYLSCTQRGYLRGHCSVVVPPSPLLPSFPVH